LVAVEEHVSVVVAVDNPQRAREIVGCVRADAR
jgi:hypothetical protein